MMQYHDIKMVYSGKNNISLTVSISEHFICANYVIEDMIQWSNVMHYLHYLQVNHIHCFLSEHSLTQRFET